MGANKKEERKGAQERSRERKGWWVRQSIEDLIDCRVRSLPCLYLPATEEINNEKIWPAGKGHEGSDHRIPFLLAARYKKIKKWPP